jgi:hypothetical protein
MLGHGPIGEGYSLIASTEHERSMLDLDSATAANLEGLTHRVREILGAEYGPCVITEHGRVPPCVGPAVRAYEPHCLHAHRLVFPGLERLDVRALAPRFAWQQFATFEEVRRHGRLAAQYLACEQADGTVDVAQVTGPIPRQVLRTIAAIAVGEPDLADWRRARGDGLIEAAQRRLHAD